MKKKPYESVRVSPVFPVFKWLTCCVCKEKFKAEKGWSFKPDPNRKSVNAYICFSCASTKDTAKQVAFKHIEAYKKDLERLALKKKVRDIGVFRI